MDAARVGDAAAGPARVDNGDVGPVSREEPSEARADDAAADHQRADLTEDRMRGLSATAAHDRDVPAMSATATGLIGMRGANRSSSPGSRPRRSAISAVTRGPQYRPWQAPMPALVLRFNSPIDGQPSASADSIWPTVTSSQRQSTVSGVASARPRGLAA